MLKFKIRSQVMCIASVFCFGLLLSQNSSAACEAADGLLETHFVVDTANKKVAMMSRKDFSIVEVNKCVGKDSKFLQVTILNLFYQEDIRADEFFQNQKMEARCEIQNEFQINKIGLAEKQARLLERQNFVNKCIDIYVKDQSGLPLNIASTKYCIAKKISNSEAYLSGQVCHVQTDPKASYVFRTVLRPECKTPKLLEQMGISAQDIETRLGIYEVSDSTGRSASTNPLSKRDVRWTILPRYGVLPLADSDVDPDLKYPSVLSTNVDQGPIEIRPVGNDKTQIDVKFLAQNISARKCVDNVCSGPADFNAPLVGHVTLFKKVNNTRVQIAEWNSPFRLPPQWVGIATPLFNIGLGKPVASVVIDEAMQAGTEYEVETYFYEPRTFLDILSYDSAINEPSYDTSIIGMNGVETLPRLPELGNVSLKSRLPKLPSVKLGDSQADLNLAALQLSGQWSHTYDRICNSLNRNCSRLRGADKAFITLNTFFKVGARNPESGLSELNSIVVKKSSETFGNRDQAVKALPNRLCD